ncbi:MAG TPA: UDP-2,4-diacetamido-2,4,6-trideoxy-beta-L-altropyranose hydrolase [Saprospiraceae bacterium]|nr:UDP-2,4-diacetamido-2,4,6-trideoxy-beta-L-altropyranose hydrolase [Saprospiraceae bacterium]
MDKTNVYFRADGHPQIGVGHVIRSLALADMLKEQFSCHFIIRSPLETLTAQILETCVSIIELPDTDDDLQEARLLSDKYLTGEEIVVLDGYHFVTAYQQVIKDKGCKLVCIDDIHTYHFVADVVINHAGGIKPADYSVEPYTQFCLGLKYALLRKPFREAAKHRTYPDRQDNHVFICLGGADPRNATLAVLKRCESIETIEKVFLVIGPAYLHKTSLRTFLEQSELDVELLENLSAEEMVRYMKKCGLAITPASTVAYEYLSVGGLLFLNVIADNQLSMYDFFINQHLAFDLEKLNNNYLNQIQDSSPPQDDLNGQQEKIYTRLFQSLTLHAREAEERDTELLFTWANDQATRQQSFNSKPIAFEQHKKWFLAKRSDPNSHIYILHLRQAPIAQVRFDLKDQVATLSYSIAKKYRGKGLGVPVLREAMATLRRAYGQRLPIVGYVKKSNIASVKVFRALDFREEETPLYENTYKYILAW